MFDFVDPAAPRDIVLSRRLTLSGRVRVPEGLAGRALVSLTMATGEPVAVTRTDSAGHYELDLPRPGRYILAVVDANGERALARSVTVSGQSMSADVRAGSPAVQQIQL